MHSPASTRGFASLLIGRQGIVVSILRDGTLALIALEGELGELPGGVRRWSVHWDDLQIDWGQSKPEKGQQAGE
ncbi:MULTISPECIES: hypothetical protein [unclassified Nonomuraea]|uniref:hypothetical protein n=1 Tax=unclassified Nonomuraea TaxID=2593643 RepID=UPI0033D739FF